ncbi:MAG: NERD domain-containing protein [Candidatus Marinimicrobia bacterium]|nr:NERD domain-containing protein [Candidatus Neomarinimicrobiota bacterium]
MSGGPESGGVRSAGSPGWQSRRQGWGRLLWPLALPVFAAGYLVRALCPWPALTVEGGGFLLLVVGGLTALALARSQRRLAQFRRGARGEEYVAGVLAGLPPTYRVLHGVGAGRQGVDHVVLGPPGLFAIETKNWSGVVSIVDDHVLWNGERPTRPPLAQVAGQLEWLRGILTAGGALATPLYPVLCFVRNNLAQGPETVAGVRLLGPDQLLAHITRQPPAWDEAACRRAMTLLAREIE